MASGSSNIRNIRSSSRITANKVNNKNENTTNSNPANTITTNITTATSNSVPMNTNPALPILPTQGDGPQTTSSPETISTLRTPEYSSLTAQEIVQQRGNMNRPNSRLPRLSEQVDQQIPPNEEGISLREYVSASVGAAQATIMRQMQENLNVMIPQIIRESLRSERNSTFENHQQQNQPQNHYQNYNNNQRNNRSFVDQTFHTPQHPPQQRPQFVTQNMAIGYNTNTPLQMEKWGLKFDGTSKSFSVEDFVFRVESLREDYNCPWLVLMKGFHHLVTGNAQQWFWDFRRQNPSCDWNHLRYHLLRKFRRYESDYEIQRKIMERRQQTSESADIYIAEIIKLQNQLRIAIPEYELVRMVKENLKDGVAQLVFPMDIGSMDQLLEECRRAERNVAKRSHFRQQTNFRRINEVDNEEWPQEESYYEIEAINHSNLPGKQLTCWNCKAAGHSFVDCPIVQRNLFCYRCGFSDVISPNCPKCKGNSQRSMSKTGQTCSQPNPVQ